MPPEGKLHRGEVGYPSQLEHLPKPPDPLYYQGDLAALRRASLVAMVGTRKATPSGLQVARTLGRQLSELGISVISGLARGIDAEAHRGSLEVPGAAPLAVVGCGLDRAYPREHAGLQKEIGERGIVLSEYPPGTPPLAHHFPARNRIVAALADALVVVQAPLRSGALLTAKWAAHLQKDILVVPGSVTSHADQGSLLWLRDEGALVCLDVQDIVIALGMTYVYPKSSVKWQPLLASLQGTGASVEELCGHWGWPAHEVLAQLCEWEVLGLVTPRGGLYVAA